MAENDKPVITVNEGKIRGIKNRSEFSGAEFYSFFGIPYGQSTAGSARFKNPVKAKPWTGVLDGTTEKSGCIQFALQLRRITGSEDCLYNNIHTPMLPTDNNPLKPVIVNIHPGTLYHGSPETFYYGSPDYVMHHDIVFVCIAYRLHILGFLNLDLEECSGNQGCKDIILGLQWIRDNIRFFGGDPNNVTLIGSSSGSTVVHTMMVSSAAKGLFHKAIMMGLHLFNPTLIVKGENTKEAVEFACTLGYRKNETKSNKKLLAFYKRLGMEKLIALRTEILFAENHAPVFSCSPFVMTVEKDYENAVLPKPFDQLIDSTARVPLMFGICEREAAMGFIIPLRGGTMKNFYATYRQNFCAWGYQLTDEEVDQIKQEIDSFYLNGGSVETATLSQKVDIQTDIAYSNVYETLIDVVSADLPSSVFVYKFQFKGNACTMNDAIRPLLEERLDGTYHASDYSYLCRIDDPKAAVFGYDQEPLTPETKQMVETFTKLISTFARTGDPNYQDLNVEWKPTTPEKPCYFNIDKNLTMTDSKLNGERMEFWEGMVNKYKKQ